MNGRRILSIIETTIDLEYLSLITAIILMVITGYYAWVTNKILKYQKQATELDYRPFIKMDELIINTRLDETGTKIVGIQWGVKLVNVSRVLTKFEMTKMDGSIDDFKNDNPEYIDTVGYLYPDQYNNFYYPFIFIHNISNNKFEGDFSYELTYFSNEKKKYKSVRNYIVFFEIIDSTSISFFFRSKDEKEIEL